MIYYHKDLTPRQLHAHLRKQSIAWGGNHRLKIYGTLKCAAGKRMKIQNRVFFTEERDARQADYRPCATCMRQAYNAWKSARSRLKNDDR